MLLRPKTGLNDMSIQLDPGTPDRAQPDEGELSDGDRCRSANTAPNVNPDEVLAALDSDTRRYLAILAERGRPRRSRPRPRPARAAEGVAADAARHAARHRGARRPPREAAPPRVATCTRSRGGRDEGRRAGARWSRPTSAVVRRTIGSREAELAEADRPAARHARRDAPARCVQRARAGERAAPAAADLRPVARELAPALRRGAAAAARRAARPARRPAPARARGAAAAARPASERSRTSTRARRRCVALDGGPQPRRQRAGLQPAGAGGGLPLLDRVVLPQRQLDPATSRTRTARPGAGS